MDKSGKEREKEKNWVEDNGLRGSEKNHVETPKQN